MDINPFELLEYTTENGTLTSLSNPRNYTIKENVIIPSVLDGKRLTQIEQVVDMNRVVSLVIPASVEIIQNRRAIQSIFLRCDSLESITVYDTLRKFDFKVIASLMMEAPSFGWGSDVSKNKSASQALQLFTTYPLWLDYTIKNIAFYKCPKFHKIIIKHAENSNKRIYPALFRGLHELEEVEIQDGVKFIGDEAFSYCFALKKVTLPPSVIGIRPDAFKFDMELEIYGEKGTYAEKFAETFGYPFHSVRRDSDRTS